MKFFHLADLHIGKRVNGFSMLEDQKEILGQILRYAGDEKPDALIVAGDVYDTTVPSGEAVGVLDEFLTRLSGMGIAGLIISGNHDSPERLAFGGRLMKQSGIHLSPIYTGQTLPVTLRDAHGPVHFFLLPFIKPAQVRRFFEEQQIDSYSQAVSAAISAMRINEKERNVLVTHQFITGSQRCDSEEVSVGGADNVDGAIFSAFDYVALGHLHGPQNAFGERVRYAGSPLKYSFSESGHKKSVTVVEMAEKGSLAVRTLPLIPRRDLREIRGSWDEAQIPEGNPQDYLRITLTEEEDVPDAMARLRMIYPNLMRLDYDNRRTRQYRQAAGAVNPEQKTPLELFEELYLLQNNQPMSPGQGEYVMEAIRGIWGAEA
jgi:exonuclease SbcD